ncbi:hypothetical protein ACFQY7_41790 [Actinomadura luteofluorescens]|uniref:hypothetical protein n=1 Tax=Actinomadura luteofluorescens TaxID=46163 RepID=UPI0036370A9F
MPAGSTDPGRSCAMSSPSTEATRLPPSCGTRARSDLSSPATACSVARAAAAPAAGAPGPAAGVPAPARLATFASLSIK